MKPIEVQISARVKAPRNGRRIPERVIREAIIRRAMTGADVPGIELSIVRWRHGPQDQWNEAGSTGDEWSRFARFLPSASFIVYKVEQIRSR